MNTRRNRLRWLPNGIFTPRWAQICLHDPEPRLARWLHHFVGPTFVDIGAGLGHLVRQLIALGHGGYGIDGINGVEELSGGVVRRGDLTMPLVGCPAAHTGICLEVGEHIPAQFEDEFWHNVNRLTRTRLIMSWAPLEQRGNGHVNCREPDYVAAHIMALGFAIHLRDTRALRRRAGRAWSRKLWVAERRLLDGFPMAT